MNMMMTTRTRAEGHMAVEAAIVMGKMMMMMMMKSVAVMRIMKTTMTMILTTCMMKMRKGMTMKTKTKTRAIVSNVAAVGDLVADAAVQIREAGLEGLHPGGDLPPWIRNNAVA